MKTERISKNSQVLHCNIKWVILLYLVHTGNLQFLATFYNLAVKEHGFCPKLVKYQ